MFDKVCNKKWSLTSILGDYISKSMIKRDLSQKKVNYGKKFAVFKLILKHLENMKEENGRFDFLIST